MTYGTNGYVKATYNAATLTNSPGDVVALSAAATAGGNVAAFALNTEGKAVNLGGNTLTLGDGTNAGGLILASGSSISNGTLAFGGSEGVIWLSGSNPTISAQMTGSNGLTFAGSGGVTLSTATNVSGAITIDSGTVTLAATNIFAGNSTGILLGDVKKSPAPAVLDITANNALASLNSIGGNSTINISNGAALTIGDTTTNLDSTILSTIAQTGVGVLGALTKDGSGILDLSSSAGVSFASGSTVVVNGGALRIANGIFGASATTPIILGAGTELQYAGNGGSKFNDPIEGAGIFHVIGGTVQLTSTANTYSGGTVVEQGSTLDLTTANVSSGNANIVDAGGLIVFDQASTGTYSGVISDGRQMEASSGPLLSGSLVKDDSSGANGGNLILAAVQAYTGGTFVEAGTLTLGVADAIASSSGVDLGRVGGPAGTGAAPSNGPVTATLALTADNAIQGLTNETGNNTAVQLNSSTLTLNVASGLAFQYSGVIGGSGGLVMAGNGTESLTGASTYTGQTTVNGGLLTVDGSIASSSLTMVNAAGALSGTGTVGNTAINGGILAPGDSVGTLHVNGNLAFTTAATYLVEIGQTAFGQTQVSGTAALAGTVQAGSPTGSYKFDQAYTILSAVGGLGGSQFNVLELPSFITGALSYSPTNVSLTLNLALERLAGLNANQSSIGSAIDRAANSGGSLPAGFGSLLSLPPAAIPSALTQLSGEVGTSPQQTTIDAMSQFVDLMLDRMGSEGTSSAPTPSATAAYAGDSAYAANGTPRSQSERDAYASLVTKAPPRPINPLLPSWSVWVAGFGGSQTTDGNAALGSNGTSSQIYGTAVGADYRISPNTIAGFALAGGATNFSVGSIGTGRSDLFQAGAYVRHNIGPAYISAALAYGWQNITTNRTVTLDGTGALRANFDANAISGRLEGGYRFQTPWWGVGVTPYAAAAFTTFDLPSYAEQSVSGTNAFALSYGSQSVTDPRTEFGFHTDKSYAVDTAIVTLRARTAWAYDYDTSRSAMATFQSLPAASFVVNGAALAHNSALTTASAEVKWLNGFSVAATFEGEFSEVTRSYAGKGVLRYQW